MVFFRHLTEWIFIFLYSKALNLRKLSKNPFSNFSEAGLAKEIFASKAGLRPARGRPLAGLAEIRKSDIFSKNAFKNVFFQNY